MRYRLRTLLIVLTLGPPLLAVGWTKGSKAVAAFFAEASEDKLGIEVVDGPPSEPLGTTVIFPAFAFELYDDTDAPCDGGEALRIGLERLRKSREKERQREVAKWWFSTLRNLLPGKDH